MKGLSIAIVFLFITVFWISAQTAVITELAGTVELKHAGSAVWENAQRGLALAADTVISTGFKSSALLRMGSSVITVRPLTRLTLAELSTTAGTETINVNLQTGRIRVDTTPPAGTRSSMTVRGPSTSASVRGTSFEYDTENLTVIEGTVTFTCSASDVPLLIDTGRSSYIVEQSGRAALLEETIVPVLKPDLPIGSQEFRFREKIIPATEEYTVDFGTDVLF